MIGHKVRGRPTPPHHAEVIEMADHRIYWSADHWQTATLIDSYGRVQQLKGEALNHARFLAASQASWAGNAF